MKLELIQTAIKIAMKERNSLEVETLRDAVAAIKKAAIDRRCEIDDILTNEILLKEQKMIKEMIDTCPADRTELMEKYNNKLAIINKFCPQLTTDPNEIRTIILVKCAELNIDPKTTNKGQFMKTLMPHLKGEVDMKVANQVITTLLK